MSAYLHTGFIQVQCFLRLDITPALASDIGAIFTGSKVVVMQGLKHACAHSDTVNDRHLKFI